MTIRKLWSRFQLQCALYSLLAVGLPVQSQEGSLAPPAAKPPRQRLLTGADERRAKELQIKIADLRRAGKFAQAQVPAQELLAIRTRIQGAAHWQTQDAQRLVELLDKVATLPAEAQGDLTRAEKLEADAREFYRRGRDPEAVPLQRRVLAIRQRHLGPAHLEVARTINDLALYLKESGKPTEAAPLYRQALTIYQKVLGEAHPHTATSYNNVAANLNAQGKYDAAEALYRRALAIREKVLGDDHPDTAGSYNNLGSNLNAQGKYAKGEPVLRRALSIRLKVLGEDDVQTATSYNNLAVNLEAQAKYAEAESLHRRALAILQNLLGEDHPHTAASYDNLAFNLNAQGRYAEAEPVFRMAQAIRMKILGGDHPDTATSYSHVAANLNAQGQYAAAEPLLRRALAIRLKVLGEDHPYTATSFNDLAHNLNAQGNYGEADPLCRRALATYQKVLGEGHPFTAASCDNVASTLDAQGRYAEAEPLYRRALAIRLKILGEGHPLTATSWNNIAGNLYAQSRFAEAEVLLRRALANCLKVLGEDHPLTALSYSNLAGNLDALGQYAEAESFYRHALAIWLKVVGEDHGATATSYDNLAYNLNARGKYTEAEVCWGQAAKAFEVVRLRSGATGLERASFAKAHFPPWPALAACQARLGKPLLAWQSLEAGLARGLLDDLSARLTPTLTLAERQRQQVLNATLDRLDGQIGRAFPAKQPTDADRARFQGLVHERQAAQAELARLAAALAARQVYDRCRIQEKLPADAAWIAWVDLKALPKATDANGDHWACVLRHQGDPVWVRLPGSGPRGAWTEDDDDLLDRFRRAVSNPPGQFREDREAITRQLYTQRLAPLQSYLFATETLQAVKRLFVCPVWGMASVPVDALTDRYTISYAPSGTLLAKLAEKHQAALGKASAPSQLLALGDPGFHGYERLPGTRREVQAIARLFDQPLVLLDSEASSERLEALAQKDKLRPFRYLHFATHGEVNYRVALHSALILARDPPAATEPMAANQQRSVGRLTAAQMLQWHLDADLVTLSACQSGLGKQAGGEGFLGFAQALFLAGARSVVLSLWKVDDTATALLMTRFYQNLLGKRDGLKQPLPKAEALAEAKRWLRGLTKAEAAQIKAALPQPAGAKQNQADLEAGDPEERPYAHPFYWSAFILIGDPI